MFCFGKCPWFLEKSDFKNCSLSKTEKKLKLEKIKNKWKSNMKIDKTGKRKGKNERKRERKIGK